MGNELNRQAFHLFFGLFLAGASLVLGQVWFVLLCTVILLGEAFIIAFPTVLSHFLFEHFERKDQKPFPGKGAIAYTVGALVCALLFPQHVFPALLVLAVADSLSTLVGKYAGRHRTLWSDRKTYEGMLAFYVASAAILAFHTPLWPLGALVVTFVEAADYRQLFLLDDNLVIPLAVGALLVLI